MIRNKGVLLAFFFTCLTLSPLAALSVSLQIVQVDAAHDEVRSPSYLIETGIMDYFFEQGVIVSNLPAVLASSDKKNAEAVRKGLSDSQTGALDYYVQLFVEYTHNSLNDSPDAKLLSSIKEVKWTIFDVDTQKELGSWNKKIEKLMRNQNTEIGITNFASDLAVEIYSFLLKR